MHQCEFGAPTKHLYIIYFLVFVRSFFSYTQIKFPGERYAAAGATHDKASGGGGFTLLEFLDANFDHASGNIFMVGRPNFPEPSMDAAYDFVPVGLARRVVRRLNSAPLPAALWVCHSSKAWAIVAAEFRAVATVGDTYGINSNGVWGLIATLVDRRRRGGSRRATAASTTENNDGSEDGSLSLPPRDKYGPEWWESTLRIIVYDAAAETAAYGLERALAVPDEERGPFERDMMVTAVLYLEAVLRSYNGMWVGRACFCFVPCFFILFRRISSRYRVNSSRKINVGFSTACVSS